MDMSSVRDAAKKFGPAITELRHEIHRHPELSWQEVQTSIRIEKILQELGFINIRRGFKGTGSGVSADLVGNAEGPCVALRADIDALPIPEENEFPYRSEVDGVMHACGHDAHAAMLAGAAMVLASMKDSLPGTVRLIFQPAEESGIDSGAPAMVKEGVLDGVDAIAGLHVWSQLPVGTCGFRQGPLMASSDKWELLIRGEGGHGAVPHRAVDPTIAAAHIITALQTIVSREIDPQESVVFSIGSLNSGWAFNVIPDTAYMEGNFRTTNAEVRAGMEERIRRIASGVAAGMRCEIDLTCTPLYPVTVNEAETTALLQWTAAQIMGDDAIREVPISMGSEDFSFFGEKVPAAFCLLGTADPAAGTDLPHHSPRFDAGDAALTDGAALLAGFALNFLREKSAEHW